MYLHIVTYYEYRAERYRKDTRWVDRYLYIAGHVHRYKQLMLNGLMTWASMILGVF
ncbi:hypothetical protein [Mesorhizobium sp. M1A.F.Ca.IN.022.06.1.1]|uniref:hypothetical protein n=1 Tax=Mesorhizobium sp. M1A.F.Ca.IN.022.06.1.1 TaxID=2493680 RepID=UPI001ABFDF2F|nr:hypothetical protein [Mesorhizobium sp. M1A.F.Ca.IN.022.06.1.1]